MFSGRQLWSETPSLIGYRSSEIHRHRRKPWDRALNTASVKGFVPIIQNRVQQLVEALSTKDGQIIDLARWVGFFTYVFLSYANCYPTHILQIRLHGRHGVSQNPFTEVQLLTFARSFGGWTEMIREGGDHNGLWAVLKSGLK